MSEEMENGFGGGMWIFALLILLLIGNGGNGFLGGNSSNALQQSDLQRAIDLNSIQNGQGRIESRVQEVGSENITATKDAAYNNLGLLRDLQTAITTGFANGQTCCCQTNRNIDSARYDIANLISDSNANTTAQIQKVLDAISTNRMADMQSQINQLQIQSALCGVPRINPFAYGVSPTYGFPSN